MNTILYIIQKEFRQIFRNKGMLPIIFVLPLIQLLILSNAATFEVKNIKFSYIDNDVRNIFVEPPNDSLTLNESIIYLQTNTPLLFTNLGSNFITITQKLNTFTVCGYVIDINTNATIEGVVLFPSAFVITTGSFPSITETHEFVVPKSIPIILLMSI